MTSAGSLLTAVLGLSLLAALMTVTVHVATRLAARSFGVPGFRWFDARPAAASAGRRFALRLAGGLAPAGVCAALFFLASVIDGEVVTTTRVNVMDGPARAAGVTDGDRVMAIDGRPVDTWEALREAVRERRGERRLLVERSGARSEIRVTPTEAGVIGITPIMERRRASVADSLARAIVKPFATPAAMLHAALLPRRSGVELAGPVGIVRAARKDTESGSLFGVLALLSAAYWPLFLAVHGFDAATLALFQRTRPTLPPGDAAEERSLRIARRRHALMAALACLLGVVALRVAGEFMSEAPPLAGAVAFLAGAGAAAHYPLVWLLASDLRSRRSAALLLGVCIAVPCAGLAVGAWLVSLAGSRRPAQ